MSDKVFLKASCRKKEFSNGGSVVNIGIKVSDLAEFVKAHQTGSGYINLVLSERRTTSERGDSHYLALDTYTPKTGAGARQDAAHSEPVDHSEVPF